MRIGRGSERESNGRFDLLGTRIPLISLVYVLTVSRHLNFRHAATALGVSQSSVSQRIKDLEIVLDTVLFERRHRGVRLTEAGRYFIEQISSGLDQLDHAVKTVSALSRGMKGELRIGLHSSLSGGFFRNLLASYRIKHPEIDIHIHDGRSTENIRQVREGALDVAIVVGRPDAADCHSRQLWTERLMIALPTTHPAAARASTSWAEIAGETFLVRQSGAGPQVHDHLVRRMTENGPPPRLRRCDVERDTLMAMVAMKEGITLITDSAAYIPFPGVSFLPIEDEPEVAPFSAVWSPHNRSPALKAMLDLAVEMGRSSQSG